jgi:hypothetical protein
VWFRSSKRLYLSRDVLPPTATLQFNDPPLFWFTNILATQAVLYPNHIIYWFI